MAKDLIVKQIYDMSQKEGLSDSEIAKELGYARGSIQRIRIANDIPVANKENRQDKQCYCCKCNTPFMIRRKDPVTKMYLCPKCEKEDGAKYQKLVSAMIDKQSNQ